MRSSLAARSRDDGRSLARRALVVALAVGLGSAVIAVGPTTAIAVTCDPTSNCAPTSVNFYEQAAHPYADAAFADGFYESGIQVCGLEGSFAPLSTRAVDEFFDVGKAAGDGPTTEGNYVDSEPFSFQPAANTTLSTGDTITIHMPHPNEPYKNGGSVLPPRQVSIHDTGDPRTPMQFDSTIFADTPIDLTTTTQQTTVTVTIANNTTPDVNQERVQLKAFDPSNPPRMQYDRNPSNPTDPFHLDSAYSVDSGLQITTNNPEDPAHPNANPTVGLTTGGASNTASWLVTASKSEELVFVVDVLESTGAFSERRINQTATVTFEPGGIPPVLGGVCHGTQLAAPSFVSPGFGAAYVIVENGIGYLADASVSSSGGGEIARITVPDDVPVATSSNTVHVVVLDALSPPGRGTPDQPVTPTYGRSVYSISTTQDPVAGHPTTPPTFQANFSVSPLASALALDQPTAPVGADAQNRATVTLRDGYHNPINGKQVELVAGRALSALGTHVPSSVIATPTTTPTGQYEKTGDDGVAAFDLADSCAERVPFTAVDVDDGAAPIGRFDIRSDSVKPVSATWLHGLAVAPDGHKSRANCGYAPIRSSVQVQRSDGHGFLPGEIANNPADGQSAAIVTVQGADRFGNPAACQQVTLATTTKLSSVDIEPIAPPPATRGAHAVPLACPGGELAGNTNRLGVAQFEVTDSQNTVFDHSLANGAATFNVTFGSPVSIWPYGSDNPTDVARIRFELPSWTASTVVVAQPSAPAGTGATDSVTVTLRDDDGQPVANQHLTVIPCKDASPPDGFGSAACAHPSSTASIHPATAGVTTTDANGQMTFAVGDTHAETVYFVVKDTDQPICAGCGTNQDPVSITFTLGGFSLSTPPALIGDGHATTTLSFNLFDTTGAPFNAYALAGLDLPSDVQLTDISGPPYVLTLRGTAVGQVPVTAHILYSTADQVTMPCFGVVVTPPGVEPEQCLAQATTTLTFVSPPNRFSLSASPTSAAADGLSPSVLTVTALDGDGVPLPGVPVSLSATSGSPQIYASQPVTDAVGRAYFSVTDTTPEPVTLTATYSEIGTTTPTYSPPGCTAATPCSVMISFTDTEASLSTVTVAPSTIAPGAPPPPGTCPAATCATVTVTLKSITGTATTPINGDAVALFGASATTSVTPSNPAAVSGQTVPGQVLFYVSDTKPNETLVLYARDLSTGVVIIQTVTIGTSS